MALTPSRNFKVPPPVRPTKAFPGNIRSRADVISYLATQNDWRNGVELGVAFGRTMATVLNRCPRLTMIGVDLWAPQPDNEGPETWEEWPHKLHKEQALRRMASFRERAHIWECTTVEAAVRVEDKSLDFVFIDADHSTEGVTADIIAWSPKLKPGGMLLGHDISWPSVKAAVERFCPSYWIGPDVTWGYAPQNQETI